MAALNQETKEEIGKAYLSGEYSYQSLSDVYGIAKSYCYNIVKQYKEKNHLEDDSTNNEGKGEGESLEMVSDTPTTMSKTQKKRSYTHKKPKKNSRSLNNHQKEKIFNDQKMEALEKEQKEYARNIVKATRVAVTTTGPIKPKATATPIVKPPIRPNNPMRPKAFAVPSKEVVSTTEEIAKIDNIEIEGLEYLRKPDQIVEVGLVADRHDMYIKNYIFDHELDDELLFDFDKQLQICLDYIDNNVKENQTLVVYCTGIQSALGSIVKACRVRKVNLILKHYNSSNRCYIPQVIFDEFGSAVETTDVSFPFDNLLNLRYTKDLFTYKTTLSSLIENKDKFYGVSYNQYESKTSTKYKDKGCVFVFCDSMEKMWEIYSKIVEFSKDDMNYGNYLSIFASECSINSSSGFNWGTNWSKSYNYMTNK